MGVGRGKGGFRGAVWHQNYVSSVSLGWGEGGVVCFGFLFVLFLYF